MGLCESFRLLRDFSLPYLYAPLLLSFFPGCLENNFNRSGIDETDSSLSSSVVSATSTAVSGLSYAQNPAHYSQGTVVSNAATLAGGIVLSYSVNSALPNGLALDSLTGEISGTATTLASQANYTVTALGSDGSTTSVVLSLSVYDPPTKFSWTGLSYLTTGSCVAYTLEAQNALSNVVALSISLTAQLSAGSTNVDFFDVADTNCSGSALTQITIGSGGSTTVYVKGVVNPENVTLNASNGDIADGTLPVSVGVWNVVTSGLLAHYDASLADGAAPFANGTCTDTTWQDLSGLNNHGTLTSFAGCSSSLGWNGTGATSDPYALTFDGTSKYVSVPTMDFTNGGTISAWVKATNSAGIRAIGRVENMGVIRWGLYVWSGFFKNYGDGTRVAASTSAVNTTQWTHVTGTLSPTQIKIYINGQLETTTSEVGLLGSSGGAWKLGSDPWNQNFLGSMSEIQIYDHALIAADVFSNCQASVSRYSGATCSQ